MPNPFSALAGLEMEAEDHGFDNPDDTWETMDKPQNTIRQDQLEAKSIQTHAGSDTCQTQARKAGIIKFQVGKFESSMKT